MLHSRTKTVFQIEMGGDGGLVQFIKDCYDLERFYWGTGSSKGDCRLFEIDPNKAELYQNYTAKIFSSNQVQSWLEIEVILYQLCHDQFIPSGIYLVHQNV